jgi:hypothetical protein
MNYDLKIMIILFIIAFLIFLYDSYLGENKDCLKEKPSFTYIQILCLQYIHHFIALFITLGWLFNNKNILLFYILFIICVVLHWKTNDDKCFLTVIYNRLCGYDDRKLFNEFTGIIGLKKYKLWTDYITYILMILYILIALYKIFL